MGSTTLEDKVAQRAILMLLERIYEAAFLPCSYGFRPGRSAHDALAALRAGITEEGHRWVIDADVSQYFDSIDHFRPLRRHGHHRDTTFDFLGFTHVWGRTRKGGMAVRQITAKNRYARAVKAVHDWCKRHRHLPIKRRQEHLSRVLRGHCGYCGLTGNHKRLGWFRRQMIRSWRTWLSRRCRAGHLNWGRMDEIPRRHPLRPAQVMRSIYAT